MVATARITLLLRLHANFFRQRERAPIISKSESRPSEVNQARLRGSRRRRGLFLGLAPLRVSGFPSSPLLGDSVNRGTIASIGERKPFRKSDKYRPLTAGS